MYRCSVCGVLSEPRARAFRIVLEIRTFNHPVRPGAMRAPQDPYQPKPKRKRKWVTDYGGVGSQISREAIACGRCAGQSADDT